MSPIVLSLFSAFSASSASSAFSASSASSVVKIRIIALILTGTTLSAQNWPMFRGPAASGVADGSPLPVSWNVKTGEHVVWRTPVGGVAVSSPIIWADRVIVSTAVSSDAAAGIRTGLYGDVEPAKDMSKHTWKLVALDKRTGRVLWERIAHEGIPKTKRHPKSSQATPTPVTNGRQVIVSFGSEGLYAYDLDGKPLWQRDLGVLNAGWFYDPDYEWGVGSSPIVWKNLVIVQCDIQKRSFIAAFDAATGEPVWRTPREEIPSWSTPAIFEHGGRTELVTQATQFIRGYDPATGRELWRLSGNSEITIPTPIVGPGLIIVTNGYRGVQPIFAIRPGAAGDITLKDGQTTNESIAWSTTRGGPYIPTPVIYGEHLYVLQINGVLAAYDVRSGERVYQERVAGGASFSASPVAGDGKIYLASEDGDIFVVKAGPQYELLATNAIGQVIMATPAISSGMLIVRGLKDVIAIGRKG
jgi:outer membrane protein assembly factor BamB